MNLSDSAETTSKSLWRLRVLTVWQLALNAFGGLRWNESNGRASQLAVDLLFARFPLILLIVTLRVVVSGDVCDWIGERLRLGPVVVELGKILQWPTAIVFVMLSFSLIYYAGPTLVERRWHWVTPGSAFGTGLWILASLGFRTYLHYYNTYSTTYGSLGAVMILLAWLYVSGLSFLIGGGVNTGARRACT